MGAFEERTIAGWRVRIDRNVCIGSANCTKLAPEVFVLDEENVVTFRPGVLEIERERLREACDVCPVDALRLIDEAGTQLVP